MGGIQRGQGEESRVCDVAGRARIAHFLFIPRSESHIFPSGHHSTAPHNPPKHPHHDLLLLQSQSLHLPLPGPKDQQRLVNPNQALHLCLPLLRLLLGWGSLFVPDGVVSVCWVWM